MYRDNFCKLIGAIKKLQEDREILADGIEKVIDDYAIVTTGDETIKDIVEVLESETHDESGLIEWWLYEDVEKNVWLEDGTKVDLKTAEQLYEYLMGEEEK